MDVTLSPALEHIFRNPYWHALNTEQTQVALGSDLARRFPADVIPFAGVHTPDTASMQALRELLAPGEAICLTGDTLADVRGLEPVWQLPGMQMHFNGATPAIPQTAHNPSLRQLNGADAGAMVGLTNAAFPGFFRQRTYILGSYFGIELHGELVAMAGERLALPGFREISAVCTRPGHTGKGYAALLISHLLRLHADAGLRSFLQVSAANERAIGIYERIGFVKTRSILFHQVRRT